MVKSCSEFFILNYYVPLQSCYSPFKRNLPERLVWPCQFVSTLKGHLEFQIKKSRSFFTTIFNLKPSINDVGNFSGFLTPPSLMSQFFCTIRRQFWPIFDNWPLPPPVPIADVVYGRPQILISRLTILVPLKATSFSWMSNLRCHNEFLLFLYVCTFFHNKNI